MFVAVLALGVRASEGIVSLLRPTSVDWPACTLPIGAGMVLSGRGLLLGMLLAGGVGLALGSTTVCAPATPTVSSDATAVAIRVFENAFMVQFF